MEDVVVVNFRGNVFADANLNSFVSNLSTNDDDDDDDVFFSIKLLYASRCSSVIEL